MHAAGASTYTDFLLPGGTTTANATSEPGTDGCTPYLLLWIGAFGSCLWTWFVLWVYVNDDLGGYFCVSWAC